MVLGTALSGLAAPTTAPAATVADLSRYCTACWRNARLPIDCWADCTQDVFVRMLERVPETSWHRALRGDGDERREFVRAIDTVKKRAQRARRYVSWDAIGGAQAEPPANDDRRDEVDLAAERVLTDRQRAIIAATLEGDSVADIANRLSLPHERVSDEKYKAIRKLQAAVRDEL